MIPKRIAVKNFLTFGETHGGKPVELVFTDDEPLWVLCGANGTGKSAVFDAITYALYGEHRGGKQKAEQLIRHNANGFEVEFDFEFGGADYRVRRTRPRKGRTTQHLLKNVGGHWKCVRGNDPAGAVKADDIEEWVADTLGLGYDAFTNSVLLQQGQADKLFTAGRDERIEVLKGIIGFEQFEELSGRVNGAAKAQSRTADGLLAQRNSVEEVSEEDLAVAGAAVADAGAAHTASQSALVKANERVANARQWEKLERERKELDAKLAAADERQRQGRQIRTDKQTLDDLTAAVPVLGGLFALRNRIAKLVVEADAAKLDLETKTAERDAVMTAAEAAREKARRHKTGADESAARATELGREIEQGTKFLAEADAIAELSTKLNAYPESLDSLLAAATKTENQADAAVQTANADATRADTLLAEAKKLQTRFTGVKAGAECPHCRQPVDESHAERVRAELADEVKRLKGVRDTAYVALTEANGRVTMARADRERLQKQKGERDKLSTERDTRQDSLSKLGVIVDAAQLRTRLKEKEKQHGDAETQQAAATEQHNTATGEAARLEVEFKKLDVEVRAAEVAKGKHDTGLATARGQEQTTLAQLSADWNARLPNIDGAKVKQLAADRDRLVAENVAEKFKALEQDDALRGEWDKQRAGVVAEIEGIDGDDRVPEVTAKEQQVRADKDAREKGKSHADAVNHHGDLTDRKQLRETLTTQHRDAAERQRLHTKLDKFLGDTGLQLELGRDAEEQIVAFANETLQHLSDGELSLEEDTTNDSTKTFDLRARRGGGEPIGVAFLSGSQRFRVAVSIALAVGQFARGRARPLEAVIIDEGFGSLDPQGLQAMAAELKRLQLAKSLRRVILVSHQPDFTDQFSVGYTLAAGENGTTATAFRK